MSPEENAAYLKALERICDVEELGATTLDLRSLQFLKKLPPELGQLALLQRLNLARRRQISDATPLRNLTALQTLNFSWCRSLLRFAPLEVLLPTLKQLYLFDCQFEDLPAEVCGDVDQNVLAEVRAHYADLKADPAIDAEIKVLFLGNGGGEDPTVPPIARSAL